ncbi:MAG: fibrobacter succinogenes major paralogous domain-containing protein [Fibromonadaceae bacterium]|nr:fibrobacter succinogenes major paralogous domain-containing protein [Fibromonadaceae bacterium]
METKLNSKGKRFFAPAIAAGLALAMAFTLNACGGDGGGGGDEAPSSSSSGNGSPSSSSSGGGSLSSSSQPSHEHTWGEWETTTAATCEAAGVKIRTCAGDNSHKDTQSIAKLSWEWTVTIPATSTTVGLETGTCHDNTSHAQTRPIPMKCGGYNPVEKFCDERDEKTYKYVEINGQTWMAENLNYKVAGSLCYDDDTGEDSEGNCEIYGRLYDWAAAIDVCPSGWHLPSSAEWDALYRFADGTSGTSSPYESPTAGKHLKSVNDWNSYSGIVNLDTHGFSALPGGRGYSGGYFGDVGYLGLWWSSSENGSDHAYGRDMNYSNEDAYCYNHDKSNLFSIRCVQD